MIPEYLAVQYRREQEKTAERALIDKLKAFPLDELRAVADGQSTKLAYAIEGACSSMKSAGTGDFDWLEKYKGTPQFAQAVELEKQLLQLDAEDQQQREAERAARPQPSDVWARRDAICLQKRMLDLDLIMSQNGGGGGTPEAKEEHAINELEQAQAQEAVEGGGADAEHEDMENAAIQQLQAAHGEGPGAEAAQQPAPQKPPAPPKPKAPPQQAQGGEGESEEEEGGEDPEKKDEKPKGMSVEVKQSSAQKIAAAEAAGRLFAKIAASQAALKKEIAKKHPTLAKEAEVPVGAIGAALGGFAGTRKAQQVDAEAPGVGGLAGAAGAGVGAHLGGELGHALGAGLGKWRPAAAAAGAIGGGVLGYKGLTSGFNKKPTPEELKADAAADMASESPEYVRDYIAGNREAADDIDANPNKTRAIRALAGGLAGAVPGALIGGGKGALIGGLGGAALMAHSKPTGKALREDADMVEQHVLPQKMAGALGSALGAIGGVGQAAKGLATSAYAKGGLSQVGKSFGNVAMNFAQKNPLAAAAAAGGAGLAAGRMMTPSQQAAR